MSVMRSPRVRNAVSRRRWTRVCTESSSSSKISASGRNEIVVPVSPAFALPTTSTPVCGTPRANSCRWTAAVAAHLGDEPLRERVDDRDADAVEAAGDLVALAAELAAGMELRQDDGEGGEALVGHDVDRDARAPVRDGDGVVRMKPDLDPVVPARERLVDRVVHDLVDEVMEAPRAGRADVHPRPQPDRLEALEDGDVLAGVGGVCHVPLKENPCKTWVLRVR